MSGDQFHQIDAGLMIEKFGHISNDEDDEKEKESGGVAVDKSFAAERDQVQSQRKECNVDIERFEGDNNKYTIQSTNEQQGMTLTDGVYQKLSENQDAPKGTVKELNQFLAQNSFDSDAMNLDLVNPSDSNLYPLFPTKNAAECAKNYIHSINCM